MSENLQKTVEAAEIAGQRFYLNVSSRFSGMQGGNRFGRNTGNSLEFMDHREYYPGDDVRHIDWSALARSDRVTVKIFREEVTPNLDIFIDGSASMALADSHKAAATLSMAAIIRQAALNSDYSINTWFIKDRFLKCEQANLPLWRQPDADFKFPGNIGKTITGYLPKMRPGGVRVLISDLFWNEEPMAVLRNLGNGAALLVVIQILAEFDINPVLSGNVRLIDVETCETLELMAEDPLIQEYYRNFSRHQQIWKESCSKTGAVFSHCVAEKLVTDFFPETLLNTEFLMARS